MSESIPETLDRIEARLFRMEQDRVLSLQRIIHLRLALEAVRRAASLDDAVAVATRAVEIDEAALLTTAEPTAVVASTGKLPEPGDA